MEQSAKYISFDYCKLLFS